MTSGGRGPRVSSFTWLKPGQNKNTSINENDLGLEESGGTRSSVRHIYIYTSEPRIWEETGSASSSMKNNSDSSVCNPEEN